MDRVILKKWLTSGYMKKRVLHDTTEGTPQGGIISPALANCALDGLERLLKEEYPTGTRLKSVGGEKPCVNLIRYADDFVITDRTKELLEEEVKSLVEQFLRERGLELSSTKTVITHVKSGFDFLGQNMCRYPSRKLLIKPSKKNIKTFLDGIRRTIKAALGMSAADLIKELNPQIRGWANSAVASPQGDNITSPETELTSQWCSSSRPLEEPMKEAKQMTTAQAVGGASNMRDGFSTAVRIGSKPVSSRPYSF
jgi:RNA-directed DNA polymerase